MLVSYAWSWAWSTSRWQRLSCSRWADARAEEIPALGDPRWWRCQVHAAVLMVPYALVSRFRSQRIIERQLSDEEIDQLALVAVAGMAAEGRKYEEVRGVSQRALPCAPVWAAGYGAPSRPGAYDTEPQSAP